MFDMESEYSLILDGIEIDVEDFVIDKTPYDNMYTRFVDMHDRVDNNDYYLKVKVCQRWNDFDTFSNDVKQIPNWDKRGWDMDKDLLSPKDNLIYSPDTICFIPKEINIQLRKFNHVGKYQRLPYTRYKVNKGWYSTVRLKEVEEKGEEEEDVLYFNSDIEAFMYTREIKNKYLRESVEKYKAILPKYVYDDLWNYKIGFSH